MRLRPARADGRGRPAPDPARGRQADDVLPDHLAFEFDHYPIRAEAGGPELPWNLTPRLIRAHRRKTAKRDVPQIAKIKRVQAAEADFRARLLAKGHGLPRKRR